MSNNQKQNNQNKYINGYKLIKENIGSGSFGSVMLMEKDGQLYAVKKIKDIPYPGSQQEKQLKREIHLPKDINDKNLIKYYGAFVEDNNIYLVSEYYEGRDLKSLIEENQKKRIYLEQKVIINIFKQILSGLKYLHDKNICHRDIKPANILINKNNEIKIIDYGLSVYLSEGHGELSGGDTQVGSVKYVSPEIFFYEANKYDLKDDMHCLGYTIFELMYLIRPTDLDQHNKVVRINNIIKEKIIYDDDLVELVEHMFKYFAEDRPTSGEALDRLIEIEKIFNDENYITKNEHDSKLDKKIVPMKCVLQLFLNMEEIKQILKNEIENFKMKLKKMSEQQNKQINLEMVNNKFSQKLIYILELTSGWNEKQISDEDYKGYIKDFIITYENRQNNKIEGNPVLSIYYNILHIINREYYNTNTNPTFLEPNFSGILSNCNKTKILNTISELKTKYKSPLLKYFYFLLIPLTKCSECNNVFRINAPEIKMYLTLNNQKNINIISDLICEFFKPENMNKKCNCLNHKGNTVFQKFILSSFPKYLAFEIKNQNEIITANKLLDINGISVSIEKEKLYELLAIVFKEKDNYITIIKKDDNWIFNTYNLMNINEEIPNIYKSASLVIYKLKN